MSLYAFICVLTVYAFECMHTVLLVITVYVESADWVWNSVYKCTAVNNL